VTIDFLTGLNLGGPVREVFLQNFFYFGNCGFNNTELKSGVGVWFCQAKPWSAFLMIKDVCCFNDHI
jgi:hypothetical protein